MNSSPTGRPANSRLTSTHAVPCGSEQNHANVDTKELTFRSAQRSDVAAVVQLLAHDALGATREQFLEPLPSSYHEAFDAIEGDPHNTLIVAQRENKLVGVLQLTLIPNMTYQGGWRAQIEGLRVASEMRGQGIGRAIVAHAVAKAREAGCHMIQLTTDKQRPYAARFYESIGFRATHEGMKLSLVDMQTGSSVAGEDQHPDR